MFKKMIAVLFMGVFAVSMGCQRPGGNNAKGDRADQLIGQWEIDSEAMVESMIAQAKDEKEKERLRKEAEFATAMKISFEFKKDGSAEMNQEMFGKSRTESGTYKVESKNEDTVTISVQDMGKNAPKKVLIRFMSDNQIKMEAADEAEKKKMGPVAMMFKRVS